MWRLLTLRNFSLSILTSPSVIPYQIFTGLSKTNNEKAFSLVADRFEGIVRRIYFNSLAILSVVNLNLFPFPLLLTSPSELKDKAFQILRIVGKRVLSVNNWVSHTIRTPNNSDYWIVTIWKRKNVMDNDIFRASWSRSRKRKWRQSQVLSHQHQMSELRCSY